MFITRALPALGLICLTPLARAHNPLTSQGSDQWAALASLLLLVSFWLLYLLGSRRRPVGLGRFWCFQLATTLCGLAVLGPLDDWAKTSSSAHMTQHMVLMVVAAPLWVLARPLPQLVAGSPWLAWLWRALVKLIRQPMLMAYLHGFVIWFWHLPYFYRVAVIHPWWHAFEHLCFLLTAGLFWWAALQGSRQRTAVGLLALLFTLMHTGFLGALLTFAREPWYDEARSLADQQLAGLIMWVAGAIPYLMASAWIGYRWYQQLHRQMNGDSSV